MQEEEEEKEGGESGGGVGNTPPLTFNHLERKKEKLICTGFKEVLIK